MATRQMTTYELSPSLTDYVKYSKNELSAIYKNAATAKGIKFMAWNNDTQRFSIDSSQIPLAQETSGATGINLKLLNTVDYNTNTNAASTSTNRNPTPSDSFGVPSPYPVNFDPANYTEYPVKAGEYAFMISKKYANSPTRWTEIIRKKTGMFLNSTSATQLAAGEILLIPKAWNSSLSPNQDIVSPPVPTNDPTKKKDDDGFLFLSALGFGLYKFIF